MRTKENSEKNARCRHVIEERHDRGGAERGQPNKQGSMEEYDHQLYRRLQITGQARDEEEEASISHQGSKF